MMAETETTVNPTIQQCSVDMIRDLGIEGLLEEHWDEVALHKDLMVLSPDWHRYYEIEERGMMLVLAASTPADGIVGYSVTFIVPHLHYSDLIVANNDLLFVSKDWRRTGLGPRLILATESASRERGARMMTWHAKPKTILNKLMPKIGYGVQDIVHSKEL